MLTIRDALMPERVEKSEASLALLDSSSKARLASDFSTLSRIKQGEKGKRCHPKSDFRL